jgi:hypothetical protein
VAIDSAAGEGGIEHDGSAAVVYGMRQPRLSSTGTFEGGEVVILDWDIRSLLLGGAAAWLRHVNDLYRSWIQRARPRMGVDGLWVERPGMGLRLLEIAGEQRIAAQAIDTEWVEWGKDGRALAVEPHVTRGRVKFARSAFDKRMDYRGAVFNHALAQITGFRVFDRQAGRDLHQSSGWRRVHKPAPKDLIVLRFGEEQLLHFLKTFWLLGGEIVGLREVFSDVVKLPPILVGVPGVEPGSHRQPGDQRTEGRRDPSVVVDRAAAVVLETLGQLSAGRCGVVKGIGHADAVDRQLLPSVDHIGRLDAEDVATSPRPRRSVS